MHVISINTISQHGVLHCIIFKCAVELHNKTISNYYNLKFKKQYELHEKCDI